MFGVSRSCGFQGAQTRVRAVYERVSKLGHALASSLFEIFKF